MMCLGKEREMGPGEKEPEEEEYWWLSLYYFANVKERKRKRMKT